MAAGGFLVWRLARGPIPLDALTPRVEATLNAADASVHFSVGASELVWAGWRRGAYLRARHVQITAPDGAVIANIPALALRVALRALLHGRFAFTRIELVGPLLRLIREPDGRIDLGLGAETEARPENPVARDILDALLTPESADVPMAYLHHVEVGDGEVIVEDRASGLVLRAPHIHLELSRRVGGIAGTVQGDVTLGRQTVSVDSTAQLQAEPRALDVQLSFRGFNPAGVATQLAADPAAPVAQQHPDLVKQLAGITIELGGSIHAHLDGALQPAAVQVELTGSAGSVTVPALGAQRYDLNGLHLAAHFDAAADEAVVDQLAIDLGGPSLDVNARLSGLTGAGTLTADAKLTGSTRRCTGALLARGCSVVGPCLAHQQSVAWQGQQRGRTSTRRVRLGRSSRRRRRQSRRRKPDSRPPRPSHSRSSPALWRSTASRSATWRRCRQ